MEKKTTCAIVVTYNGARWIEKCIRSLLEADSVDKVLIVDNNSSDETLDIVRNFNIELFELNQNLGFGKGNNFAIKKALDRGYDYIFLVNQDVYVQPNSVSIIINAHKAAGLPDCILCPIQMDGELKETDHNFHHYLMRQVGQEIVEKCKLPVDAGSLFEGHFFNAAAWIIPSSTIRKVGVFDPLFFQYREDEDYAARCRYWSVPFLVHSHSLVAHDRDQSGFKKLESRPYPQQVSRINVRLIQAMKNINRPLPNGIWKACKFILQRMLVSISARDFQHFRALTVATFRTATMFPEIVKHRRISREPGAFIAEAEAPVLAQER